MSAAQTLRSPFPWFGGKSRVASDVWAAFGDVANYVEPFAGSLAVLLGRPGEPRIETVNDVDTYLVNFWRAVRFAPEQVAEYADWPVSEADLHARHRWLVEQAAFRERMKTDPDFFDPKVAGWWVWGICQWIGGGWCTDPQWRGRANAAAAPRGIQRAIGKNALHAKRPSMGRGGRGVRAGLPQQIPDLSGSRGASGRGIHGRGIHGSGSGDAVLEWMDRLATRLRAVRVCCGDWRRVVTPAVTTAIGVTGVFLDPPYSDTAERNPTLYACDDLEVAHSVREWAIANGSDPKLRIALCGYEGEHAMPDDWTCFAWKAQGGYANRAKSGKTNENRMRERIWFSPACDGARQMSLIGGGR